MKTLPSQQSQQLLSVVPDVFFKNPETAIKIFLQCVVFYLTDKPNTKEFIEKARVKLFNTENISKSQFNALLSQIWTTTENYLKTARDERSNAEFVSQIIKFSSAPVSKEFAENLLESLIEERKILDLGFHRKTTTRVGIKKMSWRFDITMLNKEKTDEPQIPSLIIHLELTSGKKITFRLPHYLFHRLRYAVALMLRDIQFLETRQIMNR